MVPHVSQDVSGVSHIKKVCDWQRWCLPYVHRHVGRPPSSPPKHVGDGLHRTPFSREVPWSGTCLSGMAGHPLVELVYGLSQT
jgi:hypothetical protein